jgi:hypothetical protein
LLWFRGRTAFPHLSWRFGLSYGDVYEVLAERGIEVDHVTAKEGVDQDHVTLRAPHRGDERRATPAGRCGAARRPATPEDLQLMAQDEDIDVLGLAL